MSSTAPAVLRFPAPQKPAKLRFKNVRELNALKAPAAGAVEVVDALCPGLRVVISFQNSRSWSFRYANPQGLMKRIGLGNLRDIDLAAAREKVSDYRKILKAGKDPAFIREETRTAVTFGTIAEQWFKEKAAVSLKNKGQRERQMYDADLAHWATRPASEITRAELVDVLNTKSNRGHLVASNRLRALISRIFTHAVQSGRIAVVDNPVTGTKKHTERSRERFLSPAEMQRVWTGCDAFPLHQRVWFRLRLVTGQRSADLIQMRWADINPATNFWTLPGAFTKNQFPHMVYLSSLAQELLAQLPRRVEDGPFDPVWVFPAGGNGNDAGFDVMGDYPKIARRLAQPSRANIVVETPVRKRDKRGWATRLKADFTGHDLRRTMATVTIMGGVSVELLGRVLNHRKKGGDVTDSVYNRHGYNPEKQAVMEFWDKQLRCILAGGDLDSIERFSLVGSSAMTKLLQALLANVALTPEQRAVFEVATANGGVA